MDKNDLARKEILEMLKHLRIVRRQLRVLSVMHISIDDQKALLSSLKLTEQDIKSYKL